MKKLSLLTMIILLGFSGASLALGTSSGGATCEGSVQNALKSDVKLNSTGISVSCAAAKGGYAVTLTGFVNDASQQLLAKTDASKATVPDGVVTSVDVSDLKIGKPY